MVVSHLPDDPKKQDCQRGHISDGCIPFHKLLEVLAEEAAVSLFVRRVNRLTGMKEPCFFRNGHRERFYMARDLYRGSQHISLSELIDPELVSDQVFERIVTACLIRRYGNVVLQEEGLQ